MSDTQTDELLRTTGDRCKKVGLRITSTGTRT